MPTPTQQPAQPQQLDPSVIALTKAIGKQESGGTANSYDFSKVGPDGERGAYQMTPAFIANNAPKYLAGQQYDPNNLTPAQQDELAYKVVQARGAAGLTAAQVASEWNSGNPNAYQQNHVGTSPGGAHYDTPAYVNNVGKYYQQYLQAEGQPAQTDNSGTSQGQGSSSASASTEPSLGTELNGRVKDVEGAISDTATGKINPLSGLIQGVGAVAGGIGDTVNKGLELIPGFKAVTSVIGQGVGALAQTSAGQSILKSVQDFSTAHPELSKDIGAGFNILTAIPILRGIGLVKDVALDGASLALKNAAESAANKDLTSTISRTVGGRKALTANPDLAKTLVDERALPDVEGGKYTTKDAFSKLGDSISNIEDTELQPALAAANTTKIADRLSLAQYEKEATAEAVDQLKDPGPITKYFERLQAKYGDYPTIQQMNEAKRLVSRNISDAGFASPTYSVDKIVRTTLQKAVEEGATKMGLPDVAAINQKMATLIKAQDALKYIEGKPVRSGLIGGALKEGMMAGGELAGNATGIPFAGALAGRELGGIAGKRLISLKDSILSRTGKDAVRTSLSTVKSKGAQALIGLGAQKAAANR